MPISERLRLSDFLHRLQDVLRAHSPRRKYLIGVSGGRDSLVLLHALVSLGYQKLVVCHLDHGLRGRESRADAALVRRRARTLNLPFETARVLTARVAKETGKSIELAARDLRLAFFTRCARTHRCSRLFLAHHADDQIETCLFNFLRGAGAAGLAGIKPISQVGPLTILRPLLQLSGPDIAAFARSQRLTWREDASNAEPVHTRNRLRHEILPVIESVMNPNFRASILRAAEILREEDAWMDSLVPPVPTRLVTRDLVAMPVALRRRFVRRWLAQNEIFQPGFEETERVLSLLNDGAGPAKINLPQGHHARRRAGEIFLERCSHQPRPGKLP